MILYLLVGLVLGGLGFYAGGVMERRSTKDTITRYESRLKAVWNEVDAQKQQVKTTFEASKYWAARASRWRGYTDHLLKPGQVDATINVSVELRTAIERARADEETMGFNYVLDHTYTGTER
jgi:hypothetical protein